MISFSLSFTRIEAHSRVTKRVASRNFLLFLLFGRKIVRILTSRTVRRKRTLASLFFFVFEMDAAYDDETYATNEK